MSKRGGQCGQGTVKAMRASDGGGRGGRTLWEHDRFEWARLADGDNAGGLQGEREVAVMRVERVGGHESGARRWIGEGERASTRGSAREVMWGGRGGRSSKGGAHLVAGKGEADRAGRHNRALRLRVGDRRRRARTLRGDGVRLYGLLDALDHLAELDGGEKQDEGSKDTAENGADDEVRQVGRLRCARARHGRTSQGGWSNRDAPHHDVCHGRPVFVRVPPPLPEFGSSPLAGARRYSTCRR